MTATERERLPTRSAAAPDLPPFTREDVAAELRAPLAELLLTMADDEFVIGFWDSEWTGIAPMLEEDVALSSLAQDEIGHARVLYEMFAAFTGDDADRIAFGREPEGYRHARLVDHPRTDWAFTIARRWLYDTADAVRLAALARSTFQPLAEVVAKIRREETYHLLHADAWLRRLADGGDEPRRRLVEALDVLVPDGPSVFTPLPGEQRLVHAGVLAEPMDHLAGRWREHVRATFETLGLPLVSDPAERRGTLRGRTEHGEAFRWLWEEFTTVARSEPGAAW